MAALNERRPCVETVAMLEERIAAELDDEGRRHLLARVGEPVGPQGIPRMAALRASGFYSSAWTLPLVGPLLWSGLNLLYHRAVEPWLLPLFVRILSSRHTTSDVGQARRIAALYRDLTERSAFVRFHWRQSVLWGALLLGVTVVTLGLGALVAAPYYLVVSHRAWRATQRGEWFQLPLVGARTFAGFVQTSPDAVGVTAGLAE
jgi:uncharacterized membrane protein